MEIKTTCRNCKDPITIISTSGAGTYRCSGCKVVTSLKQVCNRRSSREQIQQTSGGSIVHSASSSTEKAAGAGVAVGSIRTTPCQAELYSSSSRSRKRALLCGVTYKSWKFKLLGTINDVYNMRELLMDNYGFPIDCIRVLTEDEEDEDRIPTKKNIESSLKWLVEDNQSGDSLVFFFSGHGLRQPDFNRDELDGFDESICPVDFMEQGIILDNDINSTIVWPLQKGVKLHCIVDACHSGTILDLSYVYNNKKGTWMNNNPPSGARKCTSGGLAISLSACQDYQMAADTSAFSTNATMNGAMTFVLIRILENNLDITYGHLLELMQEDFEKFNKHGCFASRLLRKLFRKRIIQDPLLSSSEMFDVNIEKFRL